MFFNYGFPPDWSTIKKLIWLRGSGAGGASLPWSTFVGNPLEFDAPKAHALKSCVIEIEPIQDLHGQDAPYPAGGGKNKCPPLSEWEDGFITATGGIGAHGTTTLEIYSPLIPVQSDTHYCFSSYFTSEIPTGQTYWAAICWYDSDGNFIIRFAPGAYANYYDVQKTSPSNAAYARLTFRSFGIADKVQFELGSAHTSYAPFENICPISGWTEAKVWGTGENLLNDVDPTLLNAYYSGGTVTANNNNRIQILPCFSNTAYSFTYNRVAISGTHSVRICSFTSLPDIGSTGTIMEASIADGASATFTTGANDKYLGIYWGDASYTDIEATISASVLNLGSTASPYSPYSGSSLTIPFGQTVYGGTLDVTTGVLTVDRAIQDLGAQDVSWSMQAGSGTRLARFNTTKISSVVDTSELIDSGNFVANTLCSLFKYSPAVAAGRDVNYTYGVFKNGTIYVIDTDYDNETDFKTAMSGVQLAYPLATPVTVQLTPEEVDAIVGRNVMWTDASDLTVEAKGTAVTP